MHSFRVLSEPKLQQLHHRDPAHGTTIMQSDEKLRVLIVDDNRDGADSFGLLVEELGNQVLVTYGGRQALQVAGAFRPDLMFVDLIMPDIDGCDLVTQLRQSPSFTKMKIIAVTGQKGDEHKVAAMKAGRPFIGIEQDKKWFDIACKRIEQAHAQGQLFAPERAKQFQSEIET